MKSQIKMKALLAVMIGLAASSCTKENVVYGTETLAPTHTVTYIVDGQQYYDNPQTYEDWSVFLDRMVALAEEGYTVQFWRGNVQTSATKEKVTYSTSNLQEAKAWCKQKIDEGYIVTMTYNQATGKYDCVAYK